MNRAFHERYFENRALNQIDFVNLTDVDRLIELNYELHILDLIKKSKFINEKLEIDNRLVDGSMDDRIEKSIYDQEMNNLSRKKLNKISRRMKGQKEKTFCTQLHNYFKQINSTTSTDQSDDNQNEINNRPVHVLFIEMEHEQDFDNWFSIAACLNLWDLIGDVRGIHK